MTRAVDAEIPPDAGRSALGHWTLANPVAAWLVWRDPALLAKTPAEFQAGQRPPKCPAGMTPHVMLWRPGWWKCWRHGDVAEVRQELEIERAPAGDVLSRLGEMLDYRWDPVLREYVVVQMQGALL